MFLVIFAFMCVGCYAAYKIGYGVGEQDGYEAGTRDLSDE